MSQCVCVPQFIFTVFVYMDWTVCKGQRAAGSARSATVNKRWIVRKTGCYLWSSCYTTAVGVKWSCVVFASFTYQQTSSLTTAKCLSHATSKELTQNNEFKSLTVLYLRQHQEPSLKQWLIHFSCFSAGFLSVKARRILLADEIEIWCLLTFTPALNFTQYF